MRCSRITVLHVLIFWVIALHTSFACAQQSVDAQLMDRITRSKDELQKVQRGISTKSREYANKLNDLETQVKNAREKVAVQQRLADEQLLSLEKLKERVEKWETQSNYQSHMLRHYRDAVGFKSFGDQSNLDLLPVLARLDSAINPGWKPMRVVTDGGRVVEAPVLKLGPVEVAILEDSQSAGLLVREVGLEPYVQSVFDDEAQKAMFSLHDKGVGLYPFDPTLGNALQLRNYGDGLAEHLRKGGLWAIPIIFFGILSLLIAVLKASQLWRLPKINDGLVEQLRNRDSAGIDSALNDVGPAQRKLVQIAAANPVSQQRDDLLVAQLMEYKHTLEKYMGVVATSAAVAPGRINIAITRMAPTD